MSAKIAYQEYCIFRIMLTVLW